MGGELIADIVARALRRFPGDPPVRFVLQPMTAVSELRRYLWESGFTIADERYAVAAGKPLRHPDRRVRRIFAVVSAATYDCLPGKGPPAAYP